MINVSSVPQTAGSPSPQQGQGVSIDIMRLLSVLLRYKWGILGIAALATIVGGLIAFNQTPQFRATASIALETDRMNVLSIDDLYQSNSGNTNYVQTQFEILKSRALAERVVKKLQLHRHPALVPSEPAEKPWYRKLSLRRFLPAAEQPVPRVLSEEEREQKAIARAVGRVMGGLSVNPVQGSYIASISYTSEDPGLAAEVANGIARGFIQSNLESRSSGALQATDWLSERLSSLKQQLRQSEARLQAFREREGLVSVAGQTSLGSSELTSLSRRLNEARQKRLDLQVTRETIRDGGYQRSEDLLTLSSIRAQPVVRELLSNQAALARRFTELSQRYGPQHPQMRALAAEQRTVDQELEEETQRFVRTLDQEFARAQQSEQQLQALWESSKQDMQKFNRLEFELLELQRDVDTNRELYDAFFRRIKSVGEAGDFERPHAQLFDPAIVPGSPFTPNIPRALAIAGVFGLLLGFGAALLLHTLDNTLRTPDDVLERLGAPLLAALPAVEQDKSGHFKQSWEAPQGAYAESIRSLRTAIMLFDLDKPPKIIAITSTFAREGKTSTALNLAAALGQLSRTLVIGTDLRRPALGARVDKAENNAGLAEYLAGSDVIDDCIYFNEAVGAYVLGEGRAPANPLEILSSQRMVQLLKDLRDRFDHIVLDTAPVQMVSDARVIATLADGIVYVAQADRTPTSQILRGLHSIQLSGAPMIGVVLNQFDVKRVSRYAYNGGYYHQYEGYREANASEGAGTTA